MVVGIGTESVGDMRGNKRMVDIPFQPTTLVRLDLLLQDRYPGLGTRTEKRDTQRKLVETLHVWQNATMQLEVRNIFDGQLWYREVAKEQKA